MQRLASVHSPERSCGIGESMYQLSSRACFRQRIPRWVIRDVACWSSAAASGSRPALLPMAPPSAREHEALFVLPVYRQVRRQAPNSPMMRETIAPRPLCHLDTAT